MRAIWTSTAGCSAAGTALRISLALAAGLSGCGVEKCPHGTTEREGFCLRNETDAGQTISGAQAGDAGGNKSGDSCSAEGAVRCTVGSSLERERCDDGHWTAHRACSESQVCVQLDDDESAVCVASSGRCEGRIDESFCDGATMLVCDSAGRVDAEVACDTEEQCDAGLATGKCANCIPGKFRCRGTRLERCGTTAVWEQLSTCDSQAACDDVQGECAPGTTEPAGQSGLGGRSGDGADGSAGSGSTGTGGGAGEANDADALSCSGDADCDAESYCSSGRCSTRLSNGEACSRATMCESSYCGNGVCCGSGTCCRNNTECRATYACQNASTCTGTRTDGQCESNQCATSGNPVNDPAGCLGRLANACGSYADIRCTAFSGAVECPATCTEDRQCDAGLRCHRPTGKCGMACMENPDNPTAGCPQGSGVVACDMGVCVVAL
jgi:hypothetical protein